MRMCALLVGLPTVRVLVSEIGPSWPRITVTVDSDRPECSCGGAVHRHRVREVVLVDLPML